jgi:hypothetical protein
MAAQRPWQQITVLRFARRPVGAVSLVVRSM